MKKSMTGAFALLILVSAAATCEAANSTVAGEPLVEPPTLISLGIEWPIQGDDNRNATASIEYRRKGESAWKRGLDLLRLQGEETFLRGALDYTAPNMFSRQPVRPAGRHRLRDPPDAYRSGWRRRRASGHACREND